MAYLFTSADNKLVTLNTPLTVDEPTVIWTSPEVSQGATFKAVSLACVYHNIAPDVSDPANQPSGLRLQFSLEQEQENGSWEEIGRQNTPISKLEQGTKRTIMVSPSIVGEEGVDQFIPGLNDSVPVNIKSKFDESGEGKLRVRLIALDGLNVNQLASVTFSVHGKRYDLS